MSAADNDRALVVFVNSQDPATLRRLKALVDARTAPGTKDPATGPDTYRGIPVQAGLRPNWDQPEAHWWRLGVQDALGVAVPLVGSLHYDSECSLDHHGYCQEHGLPGAIPCPDGEARKFIKEARPATDE
jgi:hypothetical protein